MTGADGTFRAVSWNLAYRTGTAAGTQANFLRDLHPDLLLLQEVNRSTEPSGKWPGGEGSGV